MARWMIRLRRHFLLPAMAIAAAAWTPARAQVVIEPGSDSFRFVIDGERSDTIDVHYFRPQGFTPDSPILIVMPGAGRNGDAYRDAWIEPARRYGVLVLSPAYPEHSFPGPLNYNMARMIASADPAAMADMVIQKDPARWMFTDLDALFAEARRATGSRQATYDFFGHSAGAQIGHRMALFHPHGRAGRIVAANAGWYTAAHHDLPFPYGLAGAPATPGTPTDAFAEQLIVMLGELDNADETRGDLRQTPEANAQGAHRLARGRYFHETARAEAAARNAAFAWELVVVPGVGHSYREMSVAAAEYLYGSRR